MKQTNIQSNRQREGTGCSHCRHYIRHT